MEVPLIKCHPTKLVIVLWLLYSYQRGNISGDCSSKHNSKRFSDSASCISLNCGTLKATNLFINYCILVMAVKNYDRRSNH